MFMHLLWKILSRSSVHHQHEMKQNMFGEIANAICFLMFKILAVIWQKFVIFILLLCMFVTGVAAFYAFSLSLCSSILFALSSFFEQINRQLLFTN